MEELPRPETEKHLVSYEESLVVATRLDKEYRDELIRAQMENFGRANMSEYIQKIPKELEDKFHAHGITRGNNVTNLAAFINILANNTVKGDYGTLVGGQYGAWTRSDLLVLSHYDTHLGVYEDNQLIRNEIGWVANVGAYVVSNKYYPIIHELKNMFPDKNIIRADEIPKFIEQELQSQN